MSGNYFVYITTNPRKSVLYVGFTNDLRTRMIQHYENRGKQGSFAGKYYCYNLIYFERFPYPVIGIEREKEIKLLTRKNKEALINKVNPTWRFYDWSGLE